MQKEKKQNRKNFRFTDQVALMLTHAAEDLQLPENELVTTAIFDFLQDSTKFVICPDCNKRVFVKQLIPSGMDVTTMQCKCGTKIWFDTDNDTILKFKQEK